MSGIKPTFNEAIESLTGYEEENIVKMFGKPFFDLMDVSLAFAQRSLVFTARKREGLGDTEAKASVMSMTIAEIGECFADDDEDKQGDGAEAGEPPASESGKGEQLDEPTPETSLPGAS